MPVPVSDRGCASFTCSSKEQINPGRRQWLRSAAAASITAAVPLAARAQAPSDWPAKPLQLIVPWPAGGATDLTLRVLCEEAKPLLEPLPGETRFNYALALESFSASARLSLRLNSVFYMSALLYPDDHKPGQPDNLTLCIDRMEKLGLEFRHD